jgi:putative salt-induced outer membrane protein
MLSLFKQTMSLASLCVFAIVANTAESANAAEISDVAPKKALIGQSELGYVQTSGNTKTQTLNAKLKINQNISAWENSYSLEALNASQGEQTSAEKYAAKAQGNRLLTAKDYAFGLLAYDDDRFSGFDYEATTAVGYGRKVIDQAKMKLSFEAGPGVRITQLPDADQETESILRAAGNFEYGFTDTSKFEQTLSTEAGEDRVISKSVSSLSSQIVGSLAMKLSVAAKNNSDPAVLLGQSLKKNDVETAVTLVYGF